MPPRSRPALEVVLKGELDYATTVLVRDLSEVIDGISRVAESSGRIAEVSLRATRQTIRRGCHGPVADSVELKVYIARRRITNINPGRICLVEDVKEARPELDLLILANHEILEERDIEVTPARSSYIERRLSRSRVSERRNCKLGDVEHLASQLRS